MGACNSVCLIFAPKRRKITILTIGLDNAGKTCAVNNLIGEKSDDVVPTVGFSKVSLRKKNVHVTIYDLGGGESIRGIWKNYFAEVHGVVFVVDSSAPRRIDECKQSISSLLENPLVKGKPLLLLANKQDVEGALDEVDICDRLDLENMVNNQKTPTRVETCSTVLGFGKKQDKAIKIGFKWLIKTISHNWPTLSQRVACDIRKQQEVEEKKRKERLERVQKIREERKKEEKIENNVQNQAESDEDIVMTNPFQPITEIRDQIISKEGDKMVVNKHVQSKSTENGVVVSGHMHDEITELTSNLDMPTETDHSVLTPKPPSLNSDSSRIHSPISRVIVVSPKHGLAAANSTISHTIEGDDKWAPHLPPSPDCDGIVTTVVAQVERECDSKMYRLPPIMNEERDTSTPNDSIAGSYSSIDGKHNGVAGKRKKKRNKFKRNKIIPAQISSELSSTSLGKLPPLEVLSGLNSQSAIDIPVMSSFDITKSNSDSDGRIQWELSEDLQPTQPKSTS